MKVAKAFHFILDGIFELLEYIFRIIGAGVSFFFFTFECGFFNCRWMLKESPNLVYFLIFMASGGITLLYAVDDAPIAGQFFVLGSFFLTFWISGWVKALHVRFPKAMGVVEE